MIYTLFWSIYNWFDFDNLILNDFVLKAYVEIISRIDTELIKVTFQEPLSTIYFRCFDFIWGKSSSDIWGVGQSRFHIPWVYFPGLTLLRWKPTPRLRWQIAPTPPQEGEIMRTFLKILETFIIKIQWKLVLEGQACFDIHVLNKTEDIRVMEGHFHAKMHE